jgi:hypothetical protein
MKEEGIRWSWDTIPHMLTLFLGSVVMFLCGIWLGLLYLLIVVGGMVWFLAFICTRCYAFASRSCPSGYGMISGRFFKRRKGDFRTVFKVNIVSVALQWFIPTGVGLYFLVTDFDFILMLVFISFILTGYVYLPLAARNKGCDTCPQKKECPFKG